MKMPKREREKQKRLKKPKPRVKVAPPSKRHKSKKDYKRQKMPLFMPLHEAEEEHITHNGGYYGYQSV